MNPQAKQLVVQSLLKQSADTGINPACYAVRSPP